jgi:hypothetical protein
MKIKEVRSFIEDKTQLDIGKKSRRRDYVYARAMFFYLSKKYARATYQAMAKEVKCNHASVIYSIRHTVPVIFREEPQLKRLCDHFVSLFTEEIVSDTKSKSDIISENIDLKIRLSRYQDAEAKDNKLKVTQNTIDSRFAKLIEQTPEDKIDNLYIRMEAIVRMLNTEWKDKITVYSSYETVNGY